MFEFPDNLSSSQSQKGRQINPQFLHYCPRNQDFGRQQQNIIDTIKIIERQYKEKIDQLVDQMLQEESETLNIIPKKANIDLKRSLQPKLDKLRKRTEKTIISILSKKIQTENIKKNTDIERNIDDDQENEKQQFDSYYGDKTYDKPIEFDYDFDDDLYDDD